jgi:membrane protein implicated in regulation of membrane protease activity
MGWIGDHAWEAWLIAAAALGVLELVSLDFIFVMLAGGALVGALAAVLGAPGALSVGLALITAVGLHEMGPHHPGRVKIGGEEWAALPYDEDDRIEAGETVDVVQIRGATAYVLRTHALGKG